MNRSLKWVFAASLSVVTSGCLGGYMPGQDGTMGTDPTPGTSPTPTSSTDPVDAGAPPPAPSSARPLFDTTVAPILQASCAQASCHGGTGSSPIKFAPSDPTLLYDTVLTFADRLFGGDFDKTKAQVLSKIAAGHNSAVYTTDNIQKITSWLDSERTLRANSSLPTNARAQLLARFTGCMKQADFDTDGVAQAWAQKTTNDTNSACQQCHVNGQGWLANQDSKKVFNILTTVANPKGGWFLEYYFTVDSTDPANLKVIINRDLLIRAGLGTAQHERFLVDSDRNGGSPTAMQRLESFFGKAQANMNAGSCDPPRFTP